MTESFQDQGTTSNCFGCGPNNSHGFHLKSFWEGDDAVAYFTAQTFHCGASPGMVYGGLIASLMDCHACNFSVARFYKNEGRPIGSVPTINCVTAQLNISFLKPTPINKELLIRARLKSSEGRKTWVTCEIGLDGAITALGEILAIRVADKS